MSEVNLRSVIKVRKDTAANWAASKYILQEGELGFDTTNKIVKIGDGTSVWSALVPVNQGQYSNASNITSGTLSIDRLSTNTANGTVKLDAQGKVPTAQLPSYVDDVLEFDNLNKFPKPGEDGKIYVAKDTNLTYRWSGTEYVNISSPLALGETAETAYAGNKGKANANAIAALQTRATNIENKNTEQDSAIQDVASAAATAQSTANGKYTKPSGGIPASDLAGSIPKSKLDSGVQASLGKADSALQSVPQATTTVFGGVKIGAVRATTINATTGGTSTDKCYALELDSAGKGFVRVPWENTHQSLSNYYTKSEVDAAVGAKYTKPSGGIPASDLAGGISTTKLSGLGSLATKSSVTSADIVDGTIVNADIATNAAIAASKISGLSTVATTGNYNDLSGKPSIPSIYASGNVLYINT